MRKHGPLVITIATAALTLFILRSHLRGAEASVGIALSGVVSSVEDGPMEGVVVSVRQEGSTITISVVSDEQGRYSFPSVKVSAGRYAVRIRAVGYDLEGPKSAEVVANAPATADLKLRKAKNIIGQLSD